jgi:hypothetical protein
MKDAQPGQTPDGADLQFLLTARPPHYLIGAPVGAAIREKDMREAFERALINGWIVLFDIQLAPSPAGPHAPPSLNRIFRLTALGEARLAALRVSAR